jgi:hypothetical protein
MSCHHSLKLLERFPRMCLIGMRSLVRAGSARGLTADQDSQLAATLLAAHDAGAAEDRRCEEHRLEGWEEFRVTGQQHEVIRS